jgi:hypothetical protein
MTTISIPRLPVFADSEQAAGSYRWRRSGATRKVSATTSSAADVPIRLAQ